MRWSATLLVCVPWQRNAWSCPLRAETVGCQRDRTTFPIRQRWGATVKSTKKTKTRMKEEKKSLVLVVLIIIIIIIYH